MRWISVEIFQLLRVGFEIVEFVDFTGDECVVLLVLPKPRHCVSWAKCIFQEGSFD